MKLPVGVSDFYKLIKRKCQFIDKSLFIKEVLSDESEVILLTRPRRFGKTLNLSMLHYFLQINPTPLDNQVNSVFQDVQANNLLPTNESKHLLANNLANNLFENLAISQDAEFCAKHQNKYPVIFITFKDIKQDDFSNSYAAIVNLINRLYANHLYLLEGELLSKYEKAEFEAILNKQANQPELADAIKQLTQYLHRKFEKQVIILIDEYDTPIQEAYLKGYYDKAVTLMRGILSAALKDNVFLAKAVLTGIARVSQESMFSGLNNIKVYSLLNEKYGQYFGFTEAEVKALIAKADVAGVKVDLDLIKEWYNGYQIGKHILYNPWSIINCLSNNGELQPYWLNTSSNELINKLLAAAKPSTKQQLETLLQGKVVTLALFENLVFSQLEHREEALWSLLLAAGYLKVLTREFKSRRLMAQVAIPNKEISLVYEEIIEAWFSSAIDLQVYDDFLQSLLNGDLVKFKNYLASYILQTGSYFDFNKNTAEQVFHVFILGLVVGLREQYYIYSNKEAGLGRFDVVLLPHDKQRQGIVIEFKTIESTNLLKAKAQEALKQIKIKQYVEVFKQHQVSQVLAIGLAFCDKQVELAYDSLEIDLSTDLNLINNFVQNKT